MVPLPRLFDLEISMCVYDLHHRGCVYLIFSLPSLLSSHITSPRAEKCGKSLGQLDEWNEASTQVRNESWLLKPSKSLYLIGSVQDFPGGTRKGELACQ